MLSLFTDNKYIVTLHTVNLHAVAFLIQYIQLVYTVTFRPVNFHITVTFYTTVTFQPVTFHTVTFYTGI